MLENDSLELLTAHKTQFLQWQNTPHMTNRDYYNALCDMGVRFTPSKQQFLGSTSEPVLKAMNENGEMMFLFLERTKEWSKSPNNSNRSRTFKNAEIHLRKRATALGIQYDDIKIDSAPSIPNLFEKNARAHGLSVAPGDKGKLKVWPTAYPEFVKLINAEDVSKTEDTALNFLQTFLNDIKKYREEQQALIRQGWSVGAPPAAPGEERTFTSRDGLTQVKAAVRNNNASEFLTTLRTAKKKGKGNLPAPVQPKFTWPEEKPAPTLVIFDASSLDALKKGDTVAREMVSDIVEFQASLPNVLTVIPSQLLDQDIRKRGTYLEDSGDVIENHTYNPAKHKHIPFTDQAQRCLIGDDGNVKRFHSKHEITPHNLVIWHDKVSQGHIELSAETPHSQGEAATLQCLKEIPHKGDIFVVTDNFEWANHNLKSLSTLDTFRDRIHVLSTRDYIQHIVGSSTQLHSLLSKTFVEATSISPSDNAIVKLDKTLDTLNKHMPEDAQKSFSTYQPIPGEQNGMYYLSHDKFDRVIKEGLAWKKQHPDDQQYAAHAFEDRGDYDIVHSDISENRRRIYTGKPSDIKSR